MTHNDTLLVDFIVMGAYISVYAYACPILPLRSALIMVKACSPMNQSKRRKTEST